MPALNFAPQFAPDVESGKKTQTIRQTRKRPIKAGDRLYLYTGQRTKQCRKLLEAECWFTRHVVITENWVKLDGVAISVPDVKVFARQDGFAGSREMRDWFRDHYGLPFEGQLIVWSKNKVKTMSEHKLQAERNDEYHHWYESNADKLDGLSTEELCHAAFDAHAVELAALRAERDELQTIVDKPPRREGNRD